MAQEYSHIHMPDFSVQIHVNDHAFHPPANRCLTPIVQEILKDGSNIRYHDGDFDLAGGSLFRNH